MTPYPSEESSRWSRVERDQTSSPRRCGGSPANFPLAVWQNCMRDKLVDESYNGENYMRRPGVHRDGPQKKAVDSEREERRPRSSQVAKKRGSTRSGTLPVRLDGQDWFMR